ncbi:MAG: hypothetical protein CMF49_01010 [Legionellales bacterium]|nr:hypothetical protein [Legionellales bacterium]
MKKTVFQIILLSGFFFSSLAHAGIYMGTGAADENYHASMPYQMQPYPSSNLAVTTPMPAAALVKPSNQCYQDLYDGKGALQPTKCPPLQKVSDRPRNYKVKTGSLKANVENMVAQSKWGRVVWNVPNDYRWIGNITITATSIQDALSQYLEPYPVEAIFYKKNHIVSIEPRRAA